MKVTFLIYGFFVKKLSLRFLIGCVLKVLASCIAGILLYPYMDWLDQVEVPETTGSFFPSPTSILI